MAAETSPTVRSWSPPERRSCRGRLRPSTREGTHLRWEQALFVVLRLGLRAPKGRDPPTTGSATSPSDAPVRGYSSDDLGTAQPGASRASPRKGRLTFLSRATSAPDGQGYRSLKAMPGTIQTVGSMSCAWPERSRKSRRSSALALPTPRRTKAASDGHWVINEGSAAPRDRRARRVGCGGRGGFAVGCMFARWCQTLKWSKTHV